MEYVFESFKEVIDTAQKTGNFPDAARLVLCGKIEYAVERGDLTSHQAGELSDLLGKEFNAWYESAFEIATFGDARQTVAA